jgi:hypothetical protein
MSTVGFTSAQSCRVLTRQRKRPAWSRAFFCPQRQGDDDRKTVRVTPRTDAFYCPRGRLPQRPRVRLWLPSSFLRGSLRGSMATSTPILLRNLKQSATVFAGLNTRMIVPAIRCSSTPKRSACPNMRTSRIEGEGRFGAQAFWPTAILTSWG